MTQPRRRRALFSGIVLLQAALLLASVIVVPAPVIAQDPSASESAAGEPAVRRGQPGAIASSRAGAIDGAPTGAVRRARTRAVGIARADSSARPEASPDATTSPSPDESASPSPGTSSSASPEPSPSPSVETPDADCTGGSPAGAERNRVTVVAAADIDGNGALDDRVTIESPPGTILQNVHAVSIPTDPPPPSGIFFPAGLFDYEVVVAEPGDPAAVTFHLPDGTVSEEVDTEFWVLQNGRWSDLTARAHADHVTDEVTVTLVDGGAGDEDRRADGVIADPGGPGVPEAPWTFTVTVHASVDPAADFNFFLEECSEIDEHRACTPQTPRLWVDPLAFGPTITDPEPVTLSDGESFTWDLLDPDRHYRVIEVGPAVTEPPGPAPGDDDRASRRQGGS